MTDRLLLVHAFPMDASMWEPQRNLGADLIAPDLPGFGGAGEPPAEMTMALAAGRCLEALGDEPAVVCGLSMGGYVAFEIWRQRPDLVRGLILANTKAEADDEEGRARRLGLADRLEAEGSDFLVAEPPPLLGPSASDALWTQVREVIARQAPGAIAAASRGMASRPDSRPDLSGIAVPTLVITSSEDTLIPAAVTEAMGEAIPEATTARIPGAGHLSNLEAPDEFNGLVGEHLERCR